jgi:hypothetical protein
MASNRSTSFSAASRNDGTSSSSISTSYVMTGFAALSNYLVSFAAFMQSLAYFLRDDGKVHLTQLVPVTSTVFLPRARIWRPSRHFHWYLALLVEK